MFFFPCGTCELTWIAPVKNSNVTCHGLAAHSSTLLPLKITRMQHVYEVYSNWINMAFVKGLLIHKNYREWKSEKKCFKTITFVSHVPGIPYCPCDPFSPCDPLSPRDPFSPFVEKSKVIINMNIYYYSSSLLKISVIIRTDHNFVLNWSGTKTKKIITILKRHMRYLFLTRMESAGLEKSNLT